jgi:hypothetical protein
MMIDVAYVGNRADGLLLFANFNQARRTTPPGTIPLQQRRPIPEFADITYSFNGGRSRYTRSRLKFNWRMRHGDDADERADAVAAEDNGAGSLENPGGNSPGPQSFYDLEGNWGLGLPPALQQHDELRRGTAVRPRTRSTWATPRPFVDAVLGGWQIAGINTVQAGDNATLTLRAGRRASGVGHSAGLPRRQRYRPNVNGRPWWPTASAP